MEYMDKESLEKIIAISNERPWHVKEGVNQLHTPLYVEKLGMYGEGKDIKRVLDGSFIFPPDTSNDIKVFIQYCTRGD